MSTFLRGWFGALAVGLAAANGLLAAVPPPRGDAPSGTATAITPLDN
jgi:hypothetical protein